MTGLAWGTIYWIAQANPAPKTTSTNPPQKPIIIASAKKIMSCLLALIASKTPISLVRSCLSLPGPDHLIMARSSWKSLIGSARSWRLTHSFIQPRRLQPNSYVEISHQADEREFCQPGNIGSLLPVMLARIRAGEQTGNSFRLHQAWGQMMPAESSNRLRIKGLPTRDVIVL